jgi:hypothetical protein
MFAASFLAMMIALRTGISITHQRFDFAPVTTGSRPGLAAER